MNELVYVDNYVPNSVKSQPAFKVPFLQLKFTVCDVVKFQEFWEGDDYDPERRWKTIAEVTPEQLLEDLTENRLAHRFEKEVFDTDLVGIKNDWVTVGTSWFYVIQAKDLKKLYCEADND